MSYLYITELDKERKELELWESDPECEAWREPDRLEAIRKLRDDMDGAYEAILAHGGDGLIPEHEWEDYARQTAEDLGAIDGDTRWPATHIDWEAAAADLAQDYDEVEFEGTTYYYRES